MTVPFCTGVPAPVDDVDVWSRGRRGRRRGRRRRRRRGRRRRRAVLDGGRHDLDLAVERHRGRRGEDRRSPCRLVRGAAPCRTQEVNIMSATATGARPARTMAGDGLDCASMENTKDSNFMGLRGQNAERGYAMAALLIALAIMAILLTVAMPVWRHASAARTGSRARLPRRAVRPRGRSLQIQEREHPERLSPEHRCSRPGPVPAQEVQGPDDEGRRVRVDWRRQPAARRQPGASNPASTRAGAAAAPPAARGNTCPQPGGHGRRRHDGRAQQEHGNVDPQPTAARRDTTNGRSRSTSRRDPAVRCRWPTRPTAVAAVTPTNPNVPAARGQARRQSADNGGRAVADAAARAGAPGRRSGPTGAPRGSGPGGRGGRGF